MLRSSEANSDEKAIEIAATKLLLRSYYDIVRKSIQDYVPKAIMHFLVITFLSWGLFFSFVLVRSCWRDTIEHSWPYVVGERLTSF